LRYVRGGVYWWDRIALGTGDPGEEEKELIARRPEGGRSAKAIEGDFWI